MLSSSSTLNNSTSTTSPIFYVDNIVSYLIDDDSTNYSTSYFHLPSPLIYNEFDNFGDFITNNNHDELAIIQQSWLANTNDDNNNNNNNNNINKSIDHTGDSSILEVDHKVVYSNKSGDHEVEVNGIVEDNVEMNHNISSSTTTTTNSHHHNHHHHHHGLIIKKKRRTSNKDRHSKIRTAHGLRDRRMRLSLQVARPFFKLQDLLGFDKASTTVEWLLMQSKPSIDELLQAKLGSPSSGVTTTTRCNTTVSSNSDDCDVESTTNEEREANNNHPTQKQVIKDEPKKKEKRKRTTKEERLVARERAKKRTLERMQMRGNNPFTNFSNYQQNCDDACQKNVPSYRFSTQHNIMEGPR